MFSHLIKFFLVCLLLLPIWAQAEINIQASRVWPAEEYTRITLESDQPIKSKFFLINNPARLVLDLENVAINDTLSNLGQQIAKDNPYVQSVRIGNFKPGTIRLVFDLKAEVKPQLFELKPVGEYNHRLVLDIYPAVAIDPLLALLEEKIKTPPPAPTNTNNNNKTNDTANKTNTPPSKTSPELRNRVLTIAIDAGHGGEDPGAIGKISVEKEVTLQVAQRLKNILDETPGMRGVLIRDGDYFIPLVQRVNKARKIRADLFVSIHADAFTNPEANGSSVFALSERGATSTAARWLAKRENDADLIGGVNIAVDDPHLARTLFDLSQTATINDSLKLAKQVLKEIGKINRLHGNGHVEQASFAVLKAPDIPSILVETAFISNLAEERRLNDPAYQQRLAQAIANGIKDYFSQNPAVSRHKVANN